MSMKATAEGNFQKTPFANVLLYSRERRMTGSLVVTIQPDEPDEVASLDVAGISTLTLENGSVVAVNTPSQTESLSWVLHDTGAITEDAFVKVQEALMKPGADEVATLLRLRATDPMTIDQGLRELARRRVLELFGFPSGSYAYYANVDLLNGADRLRTPEDVLPIVWRAYRAFPPDEAAMAAIVDKLGRRAIRLREPNEFERFEFGDELGLAPTQLRTAPSSLEQLAGLAPAPDIVRRMVYLLALTKQVEVSPSGNTSPPAPMSVTPPSIASAPPIPPTSISGPPRPPPVPPGARASSPDLQARASSTPAVMPTPSEPPAEKDLTQDPVWKAARAHLAKLEHKNYFEMFDLTDSATTEDVHTAFPKVAAQWHPDRAPVAEVRPLYEEIFSLYNMAHGTLVDKKSRAEYEESAKGGGGTPAAHREVAAVLDTVQDVHRAEVALKRRDFVEAERLLRKTLTANADDVSALLLLGQCLMDADPQRYAEEVINLMVKVGNLTENNERSRFVLGLALKSKGDLARARACFKQALEWNPNYVEAQRELRIIEMRIQQRRDEKAAQNSSIGGLFNKLLKK